MDKKIQKVRRLFRLNKWVLMSLTENTTYSRTDAEPWTSATSIKIGSCIRSLCRANSSKPGSIFCLTTECPASKRLELYTFSSIFPTICSDFFGYIHYQQLHPEFFKQE